MADHTNILLCADNSPGPADASTTSLSWEDRGSTVSIKLRLV